MMTTERIGAVECAWYLKAALERSAWVFSLTDAGDLHVIVGDDLPKLQQSQIFGLLTLFKHEFEAMLADQVH